MAGVLLRRTPVSRKVLAERSPGGVGIMTPIGCPPTGCPAEASDLTPQARVRARALEPSQGPRDTEAEQESQGAAFSDSLAQTFPTKLSPQPAGRTG